MSVSIDSFVKKTQELIEQERQAELDETRSLQEHVSPKELERRGVGLIKLRVASTHTGLYGRTVLVFETFWPGNDLPSHSFSPGDIAGLSLSQADTENEALGSGTVSRVTPSSISVAFDETHETANLSDSVKYKLVKLANDVTYRRLKRALRDLGAYRGGRSSRLIDVLFGEADLGPAFNTARDGKDTFDTDAMTFMNPRLDDSQRAAVRFALTQRELAIIHGPPGTGKTTTVVEVILQAVRQRLKILACAPSNVAVDNLVERLASYKTRVIRLGHPARLLESIQKLSLDAVMRHSDEAQVTEGIRQDLDKALCQLKKTTDRGKKQSLRAEVRLMRKDLKQQEAAAMTEVLKRADVIGATLTSATDDGPLKHLDKDHFDLIIIDECSQAVEAACWIPLLRGPRVILAGDHLQLPPTIISKEAAKAGLELTLMERQLTLHGDAVMRMLTMQYRMNAHIMKWASDELYAGKLHAHSSVANHLLSDLPGVSVTEDTQTALLLVDTAGCGLSELDVPDEVSKGNEGEVDLCVVHVEKLIRAGLKPADIAVIAPYNLQVELLRLRLSQKYPGLEIKSVDGFQGREKEAVVMSMVRSNVKRVVGFLAEDRRINVAVTRARRHLAVVCDSETVGEHAFLQRLLDYLSAHGEVRSAEQYIQEGEIDPTLKRPDFLQTKIDDSTSRHKKGDAPKSSKRSKRAKEPQNHHHAGPSVSQGQAPDKPRRVTKEEEAEDEERLKKILTDFVLNESVTSYDFPPSLDSRQRFTVHELAEWLGLLHLSQGEGSERHMSVSKPAGGQASGQTTQGQGNISAKITSRIVEPAKRKEPQKPPESEECKPQGKEEAQEGKGRQRIKAENGGDCKPQHGGPGSGDDKSSNISSQAVTKCAICDKQIPNANYTLHELRCTTQTPATDAACAKPKGKKKHQPESGAKSKKSAKKKPKLKQEAEEDFDAMLAAAMRENCRCSAAGCKESITTMGQKCAFCAQNFCLKHIMAEVHGCGASARSSARQLVSREGVLYRGSGVPDKKPSATRHAHLQRKLDKKLEKLGADRKGQAKS